jgi:hypothetical protein
MQCNVHKRNLPCVSRIVDFIIKIIDMIILFACLVGWLHSSPIEILKNEGTIFKKNCLSLCLGWRE